MLGYSAVDKIGLLFWLVTKIEVTKTMLVSLVTPVTALLIGWLTLDERLSWRVAAGSAAILAGIWLIVSQHRGSRIEDRGSRIEDRGSRIEN